MNAVTKENIAKRALKCIEFINRQLLRFAKMPPNELMAYLRKHPREAFCQIPHPKGNGNLQCGSIAWNKLGELADLALKLDTCLGRRVSSQQARKAVTDAFVSKVLQEAREANQETAMMVLQDALAILRNKLVVREHYLPCVLFGDDAPTEFTVGPVTFTQNAMFFRDKKSVFRHSVDINTNAHIKSVTSAITQGFFRENVPTPDESRKFVGEFQKRAIKIYKDYPWVASIKVTDCDEVTSQERAIQSTELAIHIIRILLGAEPTRKIRLAWSRSNALNTAHLYSDADGVIHASVGANSLGPVGIINWYKALMKCDLELEILGSALLPIVNPIETNHLHQRLIDAINWFGDAATDSNPSSSIVKYVSAIERLFFGKFESGRTKVFAGRIKYILDAFGCDGDHQVYDQALKVYRARSILVHGEIYQTEDEANESICLASSLSRMCLLCSAQLYSMMQNAFDNPDALALEEIMKRIGAEGLDWLVDAAGFHK
ncbi:hypothetical protein JZD35_001548 [Salmonella enterica subsp. enterica serovar Teko]|nr:hypothetical protein [Salmonella enterica subsp. enterica serovar Teko]EHE7850495.1 hypothetical protein [Salmonella enterica subsp. enterica serovar Teko]